MSDMERLEEIKRQYPDWQSRPDHAAMLKRIEKRIQTAQESTKRSNLGQYMG